MTDKDIAVWRKFKAMIDASPDAEHGEMIVHRDGSVTENRWKFSEPKKG
jgi:hypothetical protein